MNRIYQGRVTKVEAPDGKGGWLLLGFTREKFEELEKQREELRPLTQQKTPAGEQARKRLAESCARQLTAWTASIEGSPVQGKRHLTREVKEKREAAQKAKEYRLNFLRDLKPDHPLYRSAEARTARGEPPSE